MIERPRPNLPKLSAIANYWAGMPPLTKRDLFPHFHDLEWETPFCFRCLWRAPVTEAFEYDLPWFASKTKAWNSASGWLERGHLIDRRLGGRDDVNNLVPLCPLCHEDMPICRNLTAAFDYVSERPRTSRDIRFYFQMLTDGTYYPNAQRPGKSSVRKLLRARAAAGEIAAAHPLFVT